MKTENIPDFQKLLIEKELKMLKFKELISIINSEKNCFQSRYNLEPTGVVVSDEYSRWLKYRGVCGLNSSPLFLLGLKIYTSPEINTFEYKLTFEL